METIVNFRSFVIIALITAAAVFTVVLSLVIRQSA